jgi:hypothetical protein
MNQRLNFLIALSLALTLLGSGCKKEDDNTIAATDYSDSTHWLAAPTADKPVDVFYLYPTAWHKVDSTEPNICNIDNEIMHSGAASAYHRQATAFETSANVFAPYYRQADATYTLSLPEAQRAEVIKSEPLTDAVEAFDYYIKHYNNGRPFILAGHSQGSNVLIFLLSGYLKDHPEVYSRMIAAYVIGYPVTQEFLDANPHLKFAQGPDDTGVIISYNTQAPDVAAGTNPVVASNIGIAINPISWTRTGNLSTAQESLGSYLPVPGGTSFTQVMNYADARVDIAKGVLICSTADEDALMPLTASFGRGVYHSFDYPFYYFNLRQNAETRIQKYLNGK